MSSVYSAVYICLKNVSKDSTRAKRQHFTYAGSKATCGLLPCAQAPFEQSGESLVCGARHSSCSLFCGNGLGQLFTHRDIFVDALRSSEAGVSPRALIPCPLADPCHSARDNCIAPAMLPSCFGWVNAGCGVGGRSEPASQGH